MSQKLPKANALKDPAVDLRKKYPKWLEISFLAVLLMVTTLFFSFKRFEGAIVLKKIVEKEIKVTDIPKTLQKQKPPQPAQPKIPVSSEGEDEFPDDLELDNIFDGWDNGNADTPPPPDEPEPVYQFWAVSEKPEVIQQVTPVYPELAKRAGIEGSVILKVLVDLKGDVEDIEILKTHPLLEASAIAAVKQFKFTPGKQRDKTVKVWMSIPFNFRLK